MGLKATEREVLRSRRGFLVQLPTAKRTNVSGRLMEDHPAKRRRIEEPAEAAQATVAQTREVGQPTSRYIGGR